MYHSSGSNLSYYLASCLHGSYTFIRKAFHLPHELSKGSTTVLPTHKLEVSRVGTWLHLSQGLPQYPRTSLSWLVEGGTWTKEPRGYHQALLFSNPFLMLYCIFKSINIYFPPLCQTLFCKLLWQRIKQANSSFYIFAI